MHVTFSEPVIFPTIRGGGSSTYTVMTSLSGLCTRFINVASQAFEIFRWRRGVLRQRASRRAERRVRSVANRPHVVHTATNKSRGRGDGNKPKRYVHRQSALNLSTTRPDGPVRQRLDRPAASRLARRRRKKFRRNPRRPSLRPRRQYTGRS